MLALSNTTQHYLSGVPSWSSTQPSTLCRKITWVGLSAFGLSTCISTWLWWGVFLWQQ